MLWFLTWAALGLGYWASLLVAVPAAGFLVRLFMIQHDCGHGSFFRRRAANDWVGRVIGARDADAVRRLALAAMPSITRARETSSAAASATSPR